MDFVVSPPGCGWSVTDFWGLDAHEAPLFWEFLDPSVQLHTAICSVLYMTSCYNPESFWTTLYSSAPVSTGNTYQDLPRLRDTTDALNPDTLAVWLNKLRTNAPTTVRTLWQQSITIAGNAGDYSFGQIKTVTLGTRQLSVIQGDQKVSVHDYNTESYKYCSKCPPPVSRHLLTPWTVFSNISIIKILGSLNTTIFLILLKRKNYYMFRHVAIVRLDPLVLREKMLSATTC
jgi:hypothetical protein